MEGEEASLPRKIQESKDRVGKGLLSFKFEVQYSAVWNSTLIPEAVGRGGFGRGIDKPAVFERTDAHRS